jgi:hypothetical protein
MSYDLYFTKPRISREQFETYFAENSLYQVSKGEALFRNRRTGVYFVFRYEDPKAADDEEIACCASFNLNYYRPHYFGLEAEPEVMKFVERFGFSIHDPQTEGMGDGPYSSDGFLRGWNHGNEFGYSAVLRSERPPEHVWLLPTQRLEAIWRWNCQTETIQAAFREDIFVPTIFFMSVEGKLASTVVWPDAISELIPEVDFLYIGRKVLAPKRLFQREAKDECIIPFAVARSALEPYRTEKYVIAAYHLPAPKAPKEIHEFVRSLRPSSISVQGVAADGVLNQELVEKAGRP